MTSAAASGAAGPIPAPNTSPFANPYVVHVPMRVDAYLNYGPQTRAGGDPSQKAFLSPITVPDFDGLQLQSGLVQHDIFEDTGDPNYMCSADQYRTQDQRQGIYVHWSLPRMYRTGIAGSDNTQERLAQQMKLGGFPNSNPGNNASAPTFRPIPTRWVIWRTVRPVTTDPSDPFLTKIGTDGAILMVFTDLWDGPEGDSQSLRDAFVIESDCVRNLSEIPATEDVAVKSAAYIDPDPTMGLEGQGQKFLGLSSLWTSIPSTFNSPPADAVPITVSQPVNPYFADYQPQNGGILSFFDDLKLYRQGQTYNISSAYISYTIMGYHINDISDPLNLTASLQQSPADRLAACQLYVDPLSMPSSEYDRRHFTEPYAPDHVRNMRALLHGSLYNIEWVSPPWSPPELEQNPSAMTCPADTIQQSFIKCHPVAVGTNAIDALFGWLRSTDSTDGLTTDELKRDLMKIQTLVLDVNDDVDSQLQAEDLLATNNFVPSEGGLHWHFKAPDAIPDTTQPTIPTPDQVIGLRALNALQSCLNAVLREQKRLQTLLFFAFWKYAADRNNGDDGTKNKRISDATALVAGLRSKMLANDDGNGGGLANVLAKDVDDKKNILGLLQAGAKPAYFTQRDPTLFIAGLSSKWPTDWNSPLKVRLNPQDTLNTRPEVSSPAWPPYGPKIYGVNNVPSVLQQSMANIYSEGEYAWNNRSIFQSRPEYFLTDDRYNGQQGWFPLFIEWEIEYYHIPFENWEFSPQGPEARIGYGLTPTASVTTANIQGDYRILKGRCPVLPQTGAMLEATLKQVFSKINPSDQFGPDGTTLLTADQRADLLKNARALDFSSTPMSGLIDQLRTLMQGSHVTPLTRDPVSGAPVVVEDALVVGRDLQMGARDFLAMGSATALTPFASLVDIPADTSKYDPFKPCIHGQFRFTKLNIIDKFGQVIRGVQTTTDVANGVGPTMMPLFPCLGDSYSVETNADSMAKIVLPRTDTNCPFVQLPPSINQDARVNAHFVTQDAPPQWRILDEWENPVRGWLVINQANISLQVFTSNGNFVREFAVTNSYPVTRPFAADETLAASLDPIMRDLMKRFADPGWIAGFFRTITETTEEIQANPSSYSESMLSVLGRPLAVTTFGVSMELADPPFTNQSTVSPSDPSIKSKDLLSYDFGLKIGDKNNVFDGTYGLFTTAPTVSADMSKGAPVNWNSFYSYHSPDQAEIQIPNDPSRVMPTDWTLRPFYPDPHAADYSLEQCKQQQVFVGIIDPFTPINIYTALLPIQQLKLPPWTIENGVSRISTFFKLGPILVPSDVPPFSATDVIAHDYRLGDDSEPKQTGTLPIPAVGLGDWAWLQPYWDAGATKYNLMGVDSVVEKPGWENPPYTVVEGFLQQKRPFSKPDPMNPVPPSQPPAVPTPAPKPAPAPKPTRPIPFDNPAPD